MLQGDDDNRTYGSDVTDAQILEEIKSKDVLHEAEKTYRDKVQYFTYNDSFMSMRNAKGVSDDTPPFLKMIHMSVL